MADFLHDIYKQPREAKVGFPRYMDDCMRNAHPDPVAQHLEELALRFRHHAHLHHVNRQLLLSSPDRSA